jgi:hypothetical protein
LAICGANLDSAQLHEGSGLLCVYLGETSEDGREVVRMTKSEYYEQAQITGLKMMAEAVNCPLEINQLGELYLLARLEVNLPVGEPRATYWPMSRVAKMRPVVLAGLQRARPAK